MKRKLISAITLMLLITSLLCSCHPVYPDWLMDIVDYIHGSNSDLPDCATCSDDGFLKCDFCSGNVTITCQDCEGSGFTVCTECGGTGLEKCYRCHGKGYFSPPFNTMHSSSLPSVCTTCWGSGEASTCPVVTDCECNEGIWYCASCNFTGKVDCPDC